MARSAGDGFHPARVGQFGVHLGLAGTRIHRQHQAVLLQPAQDGDQRARSLGPVHRHQVGVGLPIPVHVHPTAVEIQQVQGDLGVGAARVRVGDLDRGQGRVRRIGQVPLRHPALVNPSGQDGLPVRGPPVALVPMELLGGDELGQGPGDRPPAVRLPGEHDVRAVRADDAQRPLGHVGDALPGRVRTRVHHRTHRRHLRDRGVVGQAGPEQATRQREHRHAAGPVGGVRPDAGGGEPLPFAQRPFLVGEWAALVQRAVAEQRERIGDQPLGPGSRLVDPEPVNRILRSG